MGRLKLRNTFTKSVDEFEPIDPSGVVTLYSCGPTVYSFAHIGNFRSFLLGDVLRRVLEQRGYAVRHVMNITDVGHMTEDHLADATGEDKLTKAAREIGWDPRAVAAHFERAFAEDAKALRLKNYAAEDGERAELHPRATAHVVEMLAMIQKIIDRGHAYVDSAGQVYFSVATFPDYGKLSGKNLDDLEAGARVAVRAEKRDPRDFALWKVDAKHLMQWNPHGPEGWEPGEYERLRQLVPQGVDPAIGRGFPGWHIECSAMSLARLGPYIDLHTGGEDNIFPHHECEIAQGYAVREGAEAPSPFCRYWVHARHLLVNGAKMSKRDGTFITPRDLFDPHAAGRPDLAQRLEAAGFAGGKVPAPIVRYALIASPFSHPMNFTVEGLVQAKASVERIQAVYDRLPPGVGGEVAADLQAALEAATAAFDEAIDDNLNMSRALAEIFSVVSLANQHELTPAGGALVRRFLERADEIFAFLTRPLRAGGALSNEQLAALAAPDAALPDAGAVPDDDTVARVLANRYAARRARNFARADELRKLLMAWEVEVEDTRDGVRWSYR